MKEGLKLDDRGYANVKDLVSFGFGFVWFCFSTTWD